jgi:hypothetical protein
MNRIGAPIAGALVFAAFFGMMTLISMFEQQTKKERYRAIAACYQAGGQNCEQIK